MPSVLSITPKIENPFQDTIEALLQKILKRNSSGELSEFVGVLFYKNGDYEVLGGSTLSRIKMMGALLEMAINRSIE